MSSEKYTAEIKFWRTPELVAKLLPYLDLETTLHLARSHGMTRSLLGSTSTWNKLVRGSCPFAEMHNFMEFPNPDLRTSIPPEMNMMLDVVKNLVAILKLMENPQEVLLMDLLDTICERFALGDVFVDVKDDPRTLPLLENIMEIYNRRHTQVSMGCPRHPDGHLIPLSGFLLLEEVEGAFGTTLQSLESVTGGTLIGATQLAVSSRVSRQKGLGVSLSNIEFELKNTNIVKSFKNLMQLRPALTHPIELEVLGSIGREGWEILEEALRIQPFQVRRLTVDATALSEGRNKVLHDIWDALEPAGFVYVLYCGGAIYERVEKQNGEEGWMELQEIINAVKGIDDDDDEEEEEDGTLDDDKDEYDGKDKEEEFGDLKEEELGPVHYK